MTNIDGNLSVNRTIAGTSNLFKQGIGIFTGNFSYTNNVGGTSLFNSSSLPSNGPAGVIDGTINIVTTGVGSFDMRRIHNATTGGTILIENSNFINLQGDTLLANINVVNFTGNSLDNFRNLHVTGNLSITEANTNSSATYFGGNTIIGNTTFTTKSSAPFYTSYPTADFFEGDVFLNINGPGTFELGNSDLTYINGNLVVIRTIVGTSDIFKQRLGELTGNFSYTNHAGGNTLINSSALPSNGPAAVIGGTVNISTSGIGYFDMRRVHNATSGGNLQIENSNYINLTGDTLFANINIVNFSGNSFDVIRDLHLTGNLSITEANNNTGTTYFGGNYIIGNTTHYN